MKFNKQLVNIEDFKVFYNGIMLDEDELLHALNELGSFEDPNYTQYEANGIFISFDGKNDIEALKKLVQVADKLESAKVQAAKFEEAANYFLQHGLELGHADTEEDTEEFFYYNSAHRYINELLRKDV